MQYPPDLGINFKRLQQDLEEFATIGRDENMGIYRMAFSPGDLAGRQWLREKIAEADLEFYMDGAANLHARYRYDPDRPSVITGSHIDTVPGAGPLDGALGVISGLECLRRLKELGVNPRYGVECIAFTDEEGRFGGMLGSQAIAGKLTPEMLHNAKDLDGVTLAQAMASQNMELMDVLKAQRLPDSIRAYVELHIEQGPVLDRHNASIGVVEAIIGLFRWDVTLIGESNHAGTTPMDMRKDAFSGLSELSNEIPRVLEENGTNRSVATIGRVELFPGAANVVPGKVNFTLEVRDTNPQVLDELGQAFRRALSAIARRRSLMFEFHVISKIEPVKCDPLVMGSIQNAARSLDYSYEQMPSGAAHDCQMIAALAPAGMVFIPSKGGKSHSPAEWTAWDQIHKGANVLLHSLYELSC